ncbi:MAG: hypothetical protein MR766_04345 [Erysipelotrichaceae bacterium]|nr:hypothetical protein [Erysipelotrichaceae bacterium]
MKKIVNGLMLIAMFVLELLPKSLVLYFSSEDQNGNIILKPTYTSYFDMLPFGYADFLPLIIGIFTGVCIIMLIYSFFKPNKKVEGLVCYFEIAIVIMTLVRVILGMGMTWMGYVIMALALLSSIMYIFDEKQLVNK